MSAGSQGVNPRFLLSACAEILVRRYDISHTLTKALRVIGTGASLK